jgi:uncharacterized membrane protein YfcA
MAGGMILMGVYVALLPVATAMVLHGVTQLVANGVRAALLFRHIDWRGLRFYIAGVLPAFALLLQVRYVPDRIVVYLGLGLAPFVAPLLPKRWLDFERPAAAFVSGAQVTAMNLMVGAAGPLLDVAFVDTGLSKNQIVATQAASQVFSHTLKLFYFAPLLTGHALAPGLLPAIVPAIVLASLLGTWTGTRILEHLSDQRFRAMSRYIVYAIGAVYLVKAVAS